MAARYVALPRLDAATVVADARHRPNTHTMHQRPRAPMALTATEPPRAPPNAAPRRAPRRPEARGRPP
jgi:hypothetical protein